MMVRTLTGTLLALAIVAEPAIARDRPGTPTDVYVWQLEPPLARRPRVVVRFRNTATENVHFWFEWTANGEPQPKSDFRHRASCPDRGPDDVVCATQFLSVPQEEGDRRVGASDTTERDHPFGVLLGELEFDTEYCFRFMAQDEDGAISEIWSDWVCRRTSPAPPLPGKPTVTQLTALPAKTGRGEIGGPEPDRVLVEWEGGGTGAAYYLVQRLLESGAWGTEASDIPTHTDPLEWVVAVKELPTFERPQRFRVCSANVSGMTCSDGVETKTYAAEKKIDTDLVVKPTEPPAETKIDTGAVVAPSAPAAVRRKTGPFTADPTPRDPR
jgi:hypothetical protein